MNMWTVPTRTLARESPHIVGLDGQNTIYRVGNRPSKSCVRRQTTRWRGQMAACRRGWILFGVPGAVQLESAHAANLAVSSCGSAPNKESRGGGLKKEAKHVVDRRTCRTFEEVMGRRAFGEPDRQRARERD